MNGCNSVAGSSGYCIPHQNKVNSQTKSLYSSYSSSYSSSSSKNKFSSKSKSYYYDSYDDGYEDVWLNDDYDWDRYCNDWDYAAGVDDAMDEFGWDW